MRGPRAVAGGAIPATQQVHHLLARIRPRRQRQPRLCPTSPRRAAEQSDMQLDTNIPESPSRHSGSWMQKPIVQWLRDRGALGARLVEPSLESGLCTDLLDLACFPDIWLLTEVERGLVEQIDRSIRCVDCPQEAWRHARLDECFLECGGDE